MYGLILLTVKDLIVTKFGEKVWRKICSAANAPEDYVTNQNYAEDILYNLGGAAAKTLEIPLSSVLEAAGYWFIPYVAGSEYGRILSMAGKTFSEALRNVNAMHGHLRIAHFAQMNMPNIRAVFEAERRVKVQYTPGLNTRKGLGPLVVGLLYALAEVSYGITEISITPVKQQSANKGYEEFLVVWAEEGAASSDDSNDNDSTSSDPEIPLHLGLTGSQLATLFPFHVVFNELLEVQQWGPSMAKVATGISQGRKFTSLFTLTSPVNNGTWTADDTVMWQNEIAMLKCGDITFQGQFMLMQSKGKEKLIGWFGSPKFKTIEEATSRDISLTDYAIHDQTKDTLFVVDVATYNAAAKAAKKDKKRKDKEKTPRARDNKSAIDERQLEMLANFSLVPQDRRHRHSKDNDTAANGGASPHGHGHGAAQTGEKRLGGPPGLRLPAGAFDPKKSVIANVFGSKIKEVDPSRIPPAPRKPAPKAELDVTDSPVPSLSVPHDSLSPRPASPVGYPLTLSTSQTKGRSAEEAPIPAGSYLPRLIASFHEMWIRESWHRFPLTRTILSTAMTMEASDEKPAQNVFMAVSRVAMAKGRLSALIRSVLETELSDAASGISSFLRADSPATRVISAAFELSGGNEYLRGALASTVSAVQRLAETDEKAIEVHQWERQLQPKLMEIAQGLLDNIFNSVAGMPTGVRRILIDIHDLCLRRLPEMASSAPQVLLFLRFVNPALIAPERLMIGKKHNGIATKVATAIAKAIQSLVNSADERDSPLAKADNFVHMSRFIKDLLDEHKAPNFPPGPERAFAYALGSLQEFMIENLDKLLAASQGQSYVAKETRSTLLSFISVALSEAVLRR